jgi:hypothetical protein
MPVPIIPGTLGENNIDAVLRGVSLSTGAAFLAEYRLTAYILLMYSFFDRFR